MRPAALQLKDGVVGTDTVSFGPFFDLSAPFATGSVAGNEKVHLWHYIELPELFAVNFNTELV